MISNNGKVYIKRFLAGQVPAIAGCVAYGLGGAAENAADTALQFEIGRAPITVVSYDFVTDKVIFKAVLPDDFSASIYEVALFSQMENPTAGNFGSKVLASFDSDSENWTDSTTSAPGTYSTTTARIGGDSLRLAPAASATQGFVLNDILFDLSGNSGSDLIKLAYNTSSNASSVVIRFRTDASNYYSFTTATPTAGYRIDTFSKGNAVVTGTPSWANITGIEVRVTATAGGTATVDFDGVRIEDTDTVNPEYVMVSRELLSVPFTKTAGKTQEVEFSLGVSV